LNIVVCIKQVPDSAAKVAVDKGEVNWGDAPLVLNPWDEFAIEAALKLAEAEGGEVSVLSVGKESAMEVLKTALAMGCSQAVLISDQALVDPDSQVIAHVLAAAIRKLDGVDVAFFGRQAIDGDMGVTAAQTAHLLKWPMLGLVSSLKMEAGKLRAERSFEEGRQLLECELPAVISVSKDIGEPRYPSFMGIRKASRALIPTWNLAEIGMTAPTPVVRWSELMAPPPREVKTEILTGESPKVIAEQLAEKILEEKVL
jgi:electron transfer flavoprotein beta subunit